MVKLILINIKINIKTAITKLDTTWNPKRDAIFIRKLGIIPIMNNKTEDINQKTEYLTVIFPFLTIKNITNANKTAIKQIVNFKTTLNFYTS